ncbi:MAG: hypothetical protein OXU19_17440 [bacterium]|nr:hypothetical protein [bacterium]
MSTSKLLLRVLLEPRLQVDGDGRSTPVSDTAGSPRRSGFRRTARLDINATIASHFGLSANQEGTGFLTNPKADFDEEGPSHAN